MNLQRDSFNPAVRPCDVSRALLAALEASEGRRRNRKRDQTADAFGLSVKRDLLQRVVAEDPEPDAFEEWLLTYPLTVRAPELAGPARAMARAVFEEWQLAHQLADFRTWLQRGAPSDDARDKGSASGAAGEWRRASGGSGGSPRER
jgi:hypothetical protein